MNKRKKPYSIAQALANTKTLVRITGGTFCRSDTSRSIISPLVQCSFLDRRQIGRAHV